MKNTAKIKVLILAGGMGKRLWPLSRQMWPKYMLRLGMEKSLLQQAYDRLQLPKDDRFIVAAQSAGFLIENEIKEMDEYFVSGNLILEPMSRNTAPAIMLGINNMAEDDIAVVLPADQLIEGNFEETVMKAAEIAADGYIVTIGITPNAPATGYGYIKKSGEKLLEGFKVEEFKEKPDAATAEIYIESGEYLWNAGIFVFRVGTMREEVYRYAPEMGSAFKKLRAGASLKDTYIELPNISIDYAIMEKTGKAAVVGFDGKWNDLGCWESVCEVLSDESGCYSNCKSLMLDCKNTLLHSEGGKLIAGIGLDDIIAVDTDDVLMIVKKGEGQKVKDVVDMLKESPLLTYHRTDCRPWGGYKVLEDRPGHKIKVLSVNPGKRLSLQSHKHRDEVWTVINGTCRVTLDDKTVEVSCGETIRIPAGMVHRAENTGTETLKILELATGEIISEDDITRIQDDHGR